MMYTYLQEQISLSAEYGVDYISLETLWDYGEASIGLKIAKEFSKFICL